jgi:alpha-tubulin suppressor-like RCC1 family protein
VVTAVSGGSAAGEGAVQSWRDVVAVAAGNVHVARNTARSHSVGLRADGTVVAAGWADNGQCDVAAWREVVAVAAGWRTTVARRGVVQVAAGSRHSVALTAGGGALAVGDAGHGRCDVDQWRDLVAVAAGAAHTLGLRRDGSVLATGDRTSGACDVDTWTEIGQDR